MPWTDIILTTARAALLPVGLLLPGAALLLALRIPRTLGTCFVASSALLFSLVVAAACFRAPINGLSLGGSLTLISTALILYVRRRAPTSARSAQAASGTDIFASNWWRELGPWTVLYGAVWLVLATRLALQPLSGPDVVFRWGWLPEQLLRLGSLDFYPPQTGEDFSHYFWPESIPPGVASLYAWTRLCVPSPLGTSVVVALQILTLHEFVFRAALLVSGRAAARLAVLLAAATPLLNWSLLIGQETGLAALGVTGLAMGFLQWRENREPRWLALAGLCAALAASAREYGAAYGAAGLLALLLTRAPWRPLALFSLCALGGVLVWFARTAALTGNPFYSLSFAGAPVNPIFAAYVTHTQILHGGTLSTLSGWGEVIRHFARWALPSSLAMLALLFTSTRHGATVRWLAWFAAVAVPLWLGSLGFTAGGLFYSLRVLAPALALAAVLGGGLLAPVFSHRLGTLAKIALIALVLESLPKSLTLPESPYRTPVSEWLLAGDRLNREVASAGAQLRGVLLGLRSCSTVLTEGAGLEALLVDTSITVVPLWSPDVAWLFDEKLSPLEIAARWRASGLQTIVLTRGSAGADFLFQRARWRAPWLNLREVATVGPYLVLEVTAAAPAPRR